MGNKKGGLFKSITRPTLALATWDEDGTHEINGIAPLGLDCFLCVSVAHARGRPEDVRQERTA